MSGMTAVLVDSRLQCMSLVEEHHPWSSLETHVFKSKHGFGGMTCFSDSKILQTCFMIHVSVLNILIKGTIFVEISISF